MGGVSDVRSGVWAAVRCGAREGLGEFVARAVGGAISGASIVRGSKSNLRERDERGTLRQAGTLPGCGSFQLRSTGDRAQRKSKSDAGTRKIHGGQEAGAPDPRGNYRTQNARGTRAGRGTDRGLCARRRARVAPSAIARASRRHFHQAIGRAGFQFPCEGWRHD